MEMNRTNYVWHVRRRMIMMCWCAARLSSWSVA